MEIWNIVLAAGHSTRMKGTHKLLKKFEDETILRYTVNKISANMASKTMVVLNRDFPELESEIRDLPVSIVWNPCPKFGISSSLAAAIESLSPECEALLITLADQPEIKVEVMNEVITKYLISKNPLIITSYRGKIRHPILFGQLYFNELLNLKGDQGAKLLISANKEKAHIYYEDEEAPEDIDTIEDYRRLLKRRNEIGLCR
ncbi:nucleotidyltransferase family protein [Cytobacillus oceanisediminis]|uniref:nucleotidyltransferase family protein n=1 Tax=Cytobacillus oceanisediminis TaxID=665099 RepID=UPI0020B1D128|nr:nucleotidyltransferase family protein [Cytobacillus oceanisediminis]MBU8729798.1 nucleotidyltransferase family protein [Cytobacillus oceanisediminis]